MEEGREGGKGREEQEQGRENECCSTVVFSALATILGSVLYDLLHPLSPLNATLVS